LDRALTDAGVDRGRLFVTNAVKHFKHAKRGKRRLHKRPNVYEIERCKWWLDQERLLTKPAVVVALGVTAARGVLGRTVTIARLRGEPIVISEHERAVIHCPSVVAVANR
jgi:uracil-DNA glycosylase family 4